MGQRKKIFVVTGGNGYIGSHMCRHLHQEGHEVHIIDNFSTSSADEVHSFGNYHVMDIADRKRVRALFSSRKIDGVFHFAARCLVPEGESDPLLYYRENVRKTISLLESCLRENVKNFVFSSTCAVFGLPGTEKIAEDHPQNPVNTYGNSKKILELVMRDLAGKGLLNVVVFRYFNAAGCSPDGLLGENHSPETHLIPNLCLSYLSGGQKKFQLYGKDYPTADGTCIRDYLHVDDLVRVHSRGADYLDHHPGFHDFNLGSEKGHSVQEVLETFQGLVKDKVNTEMRERRPGDPPRLVADSRKAIRELGFGVRYSLKEAIEHTLQYQNHKAISKSKKGNQIGAN